MKTVFLILSLLLFCQQSFAQTKGIVDRESKTFTLQANIREDHKFFGYAEPALSSRKLILFSVFTSDVEGNPNKCILGSYYDTYGMKEGDGIRFIKLVGNFAQMQFIPKTGSSTIFYFERKRLKFE